MHLVEKEIPMEIDSILTNGEALIERVDMLELTHRAMEQRLIMQEKVIFAMADNVKSMMELTNILIGDQNND
jgi:hypothetical protein